MCHKCAELQRRVEQLESANKVLRDQNIKVNAKNINLGVENNNLRAITGQRMKPITLDHRTKWEQEHEA